MIKTKARSAILDIFKNDPAPVSAKEVDTLLQKNGIKVNKTTIYRELQFLENKKILRQICWDDAVIRYEQYDPNCHHHIVCKECGKIEPIEVDERNLFQSVKKQSKYTLQKHIIEFFGTCPNCK